MRSRYCLAGLLLLSLTINTTRANLLSRGLIDASAIARVGLSKSWTSHIPVQGQILYLTLHIRDADQFAAYEVHSRGRVHRFTARNVDRFGMVYGPLGAKMAAEDVVEREKALGHEPQLMERTLSQAVLYVQTDRSVLQALDGETGRVFWSATIGTTGYPSYKPAADERYVATINGSTLYVLNAMDGRRVWERRLQGIPSAGPVLTKGMVHVPTLQGSIETYPLDDGAAAVSVYRFAGRAYDAPVASPETFAWTTDRGALYVGEADSGTARFRVQAGSPIYSPPAFHHPHTWFCASSTGEIYAVEAMDGVINWQTTLGHDTSSPPAPVGDAVYLVTDRNGIYCFSSKDGTRRWSSPRIQQFVAASPKHIYGTGSAGELVVMDRENGQMLSAIALSGVDLRYRNLLTDRLYLANSDGIIHCLHETEFEWPHRHTPPHEPKTDEADAAVEADAPADPAAPAETPSADPNLGPADDLGFDAEDEALFPANDVPADEPAPEDDMGDEGEDPFAELGDLFGE